MDLIMGKIIRITDTALTDLLAPKIFVRDPIESAGSLFLFDGNHQFGQFAGLPENGGLIPNVLSNKASDLLNAAESQLSFGVSRTDDLTGVFLAERTSKGGIYGILTQAGGQTNAQRYVVQASNLIRDYVRSNVSRGFYVSLWSQTVRNGVPSNAPQSPFHFAANTSNFLFHYQGGVAAAPSSQLGIFNDPTQNNFSGLAVPHARFGALGVNANTGTGPAVSTPLEFGVGTLGAWNSFNFNNCPSNIIYRAYIEDLTASGRTFSEVQAIDYALYQEAFAPGGKFHGDTFTDPATLP
jgi:hypothetical protein